MFDSNGRLRPGISSGSLFNSIGDYDQCLHRVRNERPVLETKYCLAQIDLSSKANQLSELTGQPKSLFAPIGGGRSAKIGLCLPKNCRPEDVITFGDHLLNSSFHDDKLFVKGIECDNNELKNSQSFSVTCIITLIILVLFIASSTTATILDSSGFKENKQRLNKRGKFFITIDWFIRVFSVYSGYKTLLTPRKTLLYSKKLNLKVLDGLKVISMLWIIVIHSYNFGFQWLLFDNLNKVDNVYKEAWIQWVANGTFSVDNFFLISGFLTWFKCLNIIGFMKDDDKSPLSGGGVRKRGIDECQEVKVLNSSESETSLSLKMNLGNKNDDKWNMMKVFSSNLLTRYFRLVPTMMFLILISVSLLPRLSWGPSWSNATMMFDEWCQFNWYINVFLLQNFINTPNMCFSHSWYLAVDFQLFLIINLIILLISFVAKTTNLMRIFFYTKWILISGIVIIQLLIAIFIYYHKLPSAPIVPVDSLESMINYYALFYIKPYYWLTSYFIGSLLAMCIISLTFKEANIIEVRGRERRKSREGFVSVRVKNLISIIQVVSPCALIALILSTLPYFQNTYKMVGILSSLHALLARPLWSFSLASILFSILQNTMSKFFNSRNNFIYKMIQAFLSLKLWLPLSKLTYSVYLFHPLVMAIFYGSRKETFKFSHSLILYFSLGNIVLTYLGSLFIYLTIELPIQVAIEQMIFMLLPICCGIRKEKGASNNKQLSSTGTLKNDISMVERTNFLAATLGLSKRHEQQRQGRTAS